MRLTELPPRLATARVLPSGERRSRDRLLAGADLRDLAAGLEVEDGDGVGAGVGDVGQRAVGVEVDGDRLPVNGNGGGDGVVFRIDDGDRALRRRRAPELTT